MARAAELPALTLQQHRYRADARVDTALAAASRRPYLIDEVPEVRDLMVAPPDELRSIVVVLFSRLDTVPEASRLGGLGSFVQQVIGRATAAKEALDTRLTAEVLVLLASRRPTLDRDDLLLVLPAMARAVRAMRRSEEWSYVGAAGVAVAATEKHVKAHGPAGLEAAIRDLAQALERVRDDLRSKAAKQRARLLALITSAEASADGGPARSARVDPGLIGKDHHWGPAWKARLAGFDADQAELFTHCSLATGVTPSASWRKRATALAATPTAAPMLRDMLDDAAIAGETNPVRGGYPLSDPNVLLVRGAMWAAASIQEPWVDERLARIGLFFGTSGGSSNVVRDERLANTAAAALGTRGTPESIAALGRLKAKVTNRNVSKQIAKALDAAAAASGMSASELLELAIPTEGLGPDGRREIAIGEHAAVIALDGDDVTLTWHGPDGTVTARPPVAIADRKAEVEAAKSAAKDLRKSLALERGRVEDLFTDGREWSVADWRARYLEHPLTGSIGRRLIWRVVRDGADVATIISADDGSPIDATGEPVEVRDDDRIRLWHPIDATDAQIADWRTRLLDRRLRQPFKQAFREVYSLTPAEEQTGTYSNRFAGHILRYPQARALFTVRRWGSNFLGPFDGGYEGIAKREFPSHQVRAEFWHDALEAEAGADMVAHCTTDQVRFIGHGRVDDVLRVGDVPPIVFSEAMRDVDLFVSVTTIGADRNWRDGGQNRMDRMQEYWRDAWDAPLMGGGEVRRDVLGRIVPGLAIADRLELQERWLQVRGDLRTYRIHLGSGNILMAPSDRYLCIVPDRGGASDRVFLPFDDDPTLSIILSKAFLLAADAKITDRSIVNQIRNG